MNNYKFPGSTKAFDPSSKLTQQQINDLNSHIVPAIAHIGSTNPFQFNPIDGDIRNFISFHPESMMEVFVPMSYFVNHPKGFGQMNFVLCGTGLLQCYIKLVDIMCWIASEVRLEEDKNSRMAYTTIEFLPMRLDYNTADEVKQAIETMEDHLFQSSLDNNKNNNNNNLVRQTSAVQFNKPKSMMKNIIREIQDWTEEDKRTLSKRFAGIRIRLSIFNGELGTLAKYIELLINSSNPARHLLEKDAKNKNKANKKKKKKKKKKQGEDEEQQGEEEEEEEKSGEEKEGSEDDGKEEEEKEQEQRLRANKFNPNKITLNTIEWRRLCSCIRGYSVNIETDRHSILPKTSLWNPSFAFGILNNVLEAWNFGAIPECCDVKNYCRRFESGPLQGKIKDYVFPSNGYWTYRVSDRAWIATQWRSFFFPFIPIEQNRNPVEFAMYGKRLLIPKDVPSFILDKKNTFKHLDKHFSQIEEEGDLPADMEIPDDPYYDSDRDENYINVETGFGRVLSSAIRPTITIDDFKEKVTREMSQFGIQYKKGTNEYRPALTVLRKRILADFMKHMWNPDAHISNAMKALVNYYQEHLATGHNFSFGWTHKFKNLSPTADMLATFQIELEACIGVKHVHREIVVGLLTAWQIYARTPFHAHMLLLGPPKAGKTYSFELLAKMLIEGTHKTLTFVTPKAKTAIGKNDALDKLDCMIEFYEEMCPSSLGADSNSSKNFTGQKSRYDNNSSNSDVVTFMKSWMTRGQVSFQRSIKDENGQMTMQEATIYCNTVIFSAANISKKDVDSQLLTRFNTIDCQVKERQDLEEQQRSDLRTFFNMTSEQSLALETLYFRMKRDQLMIALIETLIYVGILPKVQLDAAMLVFMTTLAQAGEGDNSLKDAKDLRNIARLKMLVEVLVIWRVVRLIFDSKISPISGLQWEPEQILLIEPYLYTTPEDASIILGYLSHQFQDPIGQNTLDTLMNYVIDNHPDVASFDHPGSSNNLTNKNNNNNNNNPSNPPSQQSILNRYSSSSKTKQKQALDQQAQQQLLIDEFTTLDFNTDFKAIHQIGVTDNNNNNNNNNNHTLTTREKALVKLQNSQDRIKLIEGLLKVTRDQPGGYLSVRSPCKDQVKHQGMDADKHTTKILTGLLWSKMKSRPTHQDIVISLEQLLESSHKYLEWNSSDFKQEVGSDGPVNVVEIAETKMATGPVLKYLTASNNYPADRYISLSKSVIQERLYARKIGGSPLKACLGKILCHKYARSGTVMFGESHAAAFYLAEVIHIERNLKFELKILSARYFGDLISNIAKLAINDCGLAIVDENSRVIDPNSLFDSNPGMIMDCDIQDYCMSLFNDAIDYVTDDVEIIHDAGDSSTTVEYLPDNHPVVIAKKIKDAHGANALMCNYPQDILDDNSNSQSMKKKHTTNFLIGSHEIVKLRKKKYDRQLNQYYSSNNNNNNNMQLQLEGDEKLKYDKLRKIRDQLLDEEEQIKKKQKLKEDKVSQIEECDVEDLDKIMENRDDEEEEEEEEDLISMEGIEQIFDDDDQISIGSSVYNNNDNESTTNTSDNDTRQQQLLPPAPILLLQDNNDYNFTTPTDYDDNYEFNLDDELNTNTSII